MSVKRKDSKGRILRDGEIQKADGRYEFRYQDANGVRRSLYSWRLTDTDSVPSGKRSCISLRELEKNAIRDVQDGIAYSKDTLNDRWENYISNKPELKASTKVGYAYLYDRYIRDEIGRLPIASIRFSAIKRFYNHLLNDVGLKITSLDNVNTVLHPVFSVAVRDGLIRTNPVDGAIAELKKSFNWERPKRHSLTEEQQIAFMKHVSSTEWKTLFTCLLGTGCRIGEMLGLRWEDILWEENLISVNHILQYGMVNGKAQFSASTTKTRNSVRVIPMMQSVRAALREEYNRQEREGFCKQVVDGCSGFIFFRKGRVLMPQTVNRAIAKLTKECGIPSFCAHQLRHTFCTRMCEHETDLKVIQEIMGHSDISTTMNVYNEATVGRKKASFARLEAAGIF